jgi:Arrestin (or S-antigen), C-terminal domain
MGKISLGEADTNSDGKEPKVGYKPLLNKRIIVVSQPPERVNFNLKIAKDHQAKALFVNQGVAHVEVHLDRDAYQPSEVVRLRLVIDNSASDQGIKKVKLKLFREIKSVSANGKEFLERTPIVKRKLPDSVPAKQKKDIVVEMALGQISLSDKRIEVFKEKKKHIAGELGAYMTMLQHSIRTATLECRYYVEIEIKNSGVFGKDMPKITVPLQIYYQSNVFED